MENTVKTSATRKVSNALVTATCAGLGVLHFGFQTSADIVSELEAKLLQRRDGSEIEDIKKERMIKTVDRQQHILEKVESIRNTVKEARNKFRKNKEYENGTMLPIILVSGDQVIQG